MANDEGGGTLDRVKDALPDGAGGGVASALKSRELLTSAALSAVGAVAAAKGPDLVRRLTSAGGSKGEEMAGKLGEDAAEGAKRRVEESSSGLGGKMLKKALGGGGGGGGGQKKTRRLPIQRWTDVAVPVGRAYEAWTRFEQFPKFMHRVQNVEQKGRDRVGWQEKIWFSTRRWEGKITDRRENDRIAWVTTNGTSHKGVVSFHPIADNLTRVMVTMEFEPSGMLEKMASGLRFVKRAVESDLARFKAFVELEDAKGIEYRPTRGEDDTDDDADDDADQAPSRASKADAERDSDRRDRERGRTQRRSSSRSR